MGRTFVAGALAIAKDQVRAALRAPFLGLVYVGMFNRTSVRVRSIKDLEPTATRYDDARGIWFFELELHDDALPNASFEPLLTFLATVPAVPGAVFIAGRDAWESAASWFALVLDGTAQELPYLEPEKAAEILVRLAWPPATDVLALLET